MKPKRHRTYTMVRDETRRVDLPEEAAQRTWLVQLSPLFKACALSGGDVLRAFALSCYLQGALDALSPEFRKEHGRQKQQRKDDPSGP